MVKAKDWTGNAKSIFTCNGASNHSEEERQTDDYYATEPRAVELLLERENFSGYVWECACGGGHISDVLKQNGYSVYSSDLIDRHYQGTVIQDFLKSNDLNTMDIITNPQYKYTKEFVQNAHDISADGVTVAMYLKIT